MKLKEASRSQKPDRSTGPLPSVLLVDEDASDLKTFSVLFEQEGYAVRTCGTLADALTRLESEVFDFIVVSQGGPAFESQSVLKRAIEIDRRVPVLVLARSHDIRCYLEAIQLGALDYFEKLLPPHELLRVVKSHLRARN